MSSRKPGYLIGLALLAVIFSAPQWVTCILLAVDSYQTGRWPKHPNFDHWNELIKQDPLSVASSKWHGCFVDLAHRAWSNNRVHWQVTALDPRTRKTTVIGSRFTSVGDLYPVDFGDRLWLLGNGEAYEFENGIARPSTLVHPIQWGQETDRFLRDGHPAILQRTRTGIQVRTFSEGAWSTNHELILPNERDWSAPDDPPYTFFNPGFAQCLNHAGRTHLFLHAGRSMMYREGLELKPLTDEPASALATSNDDPELKPWTRICLVTETRELYSHLLFGMLLNGQPIAMVVEHYDDGRAIGNFFRFDGTRWTRFAVQSLPIGTCGIRVMNGHDGEPALVIAGTGIRSDVYEVDDAQIRPIPWNHSLGFKSLQLYPMLMQCGAVLVVTSLMGILLGFGVWRVMKRYTQSEYYFGTQRVALASLRQRGVARLLDISLVWLSTIGVGWILLRELDWIVFVETLHFGAHQPMWQLVVRAEWGLLLWLVTVGFSLLYAQGRWGVTPGKWCCGLRTVRTTLRPCGFARSLVREGVLWVDASGFLCWAPGVLSIALTNCRQRLGDLVADTIVVNASSIKSK